MLGLPPTDGNERGHCVPLPVTPGGFAVLVRTLRARETEKDRRIGTAAAPVAYDMEAIARALTVRDKAIAKERASAETFLSELGL